MTTNTESKLAEEYLTEEFLKTFSDSQTLQEKYLSATPYPHMVFDNVVKPDFLKTVLGEFPDLDKLRSVVRFNSANEKKIGTVGEAQFGSASLRLMHFLNSYPFLQFLEGLTGIGNLLPDPHFRGGGFHQIKPGGFLKIHADFNIHEDFKLDRRLNALIYLNEDWKDEYGGGFELWDREMKGCEKKVMPLFNRLVVFSTTSTSYHGHPEPLTCPPDRCRRSMALYYYTNGRPEEEAGEKHSTLWAERPEDRKANRGRKFATGCKNFIKDCTPPIIVKALRAFK